jgi:hypothetical protein
MPPQQCRVFVSLSLIRYCWNAGIYSQDAVFLEPRMDVKVEMRNLLKGCLTDGMPKTHAFLSERRPHRPSNARDGRHESSPGRFVELPHVAEMSLRNDERVARMELANVEKRHGEAVLKHNAGGHSSSNNLAKNALSFRDVFHGPNENKMSDG